MASKYRKITISVSNNELNDLESYCVRDFKDNKAEKERCRKRALHIWNRLVIEWDKA